MKMEIPLEPHVDWYIGVSDEGFWCKDNQNKEQ